MQKKYLSEENKSIKMKSELVDHRKPNSCLTLCRLLHYNSHTTAAQHNLEL